MKKTLHLIACLLFFQASFAQKDWKQVKESEGIKVYTREVEGSSLDEFKGVTVVNARLEVVGFVMRDIPADVEWVSDCKEAKIIKKTDDLNFIMYFVQSAPWPVSDRDIVISVKTTLDYIKGRIEINMSALKDAKLMPINKDRVRITTMSSKYIIEYIDREHTRVTYITKADPAGSLPSSVANKSSVNIPFATLQGLKKMVKKQKYIDAANKSQDKVILEQNIKEGKLK